MNDARFSMRLPQATLDFAQGYASQCQMSVTDLFLGYLNRLQEAVAAKSPKRHGIRDIRKYRGILKRGHALADEERDEMRFKYLSEKYA